MIQLHSVRLASLYDPLFTEANEIYTQSFPLHEQRSIPDQAHILANQPDYRYEILLMEDGQVAGILCTWKTSSFVYLEHLAVSSSMRNQGIGQLILDYAKKEAGDLPLILEIDPPSLDAISTRRLGFYQRNGFCANEDYDYIHPPYKPGDSPYPLLVMSWPKPLEPSLYQRFEQYHHGTVVSPFPAKDSRK